MGKKLTWDSASPTFCSLWLGDTEAGTVYGPSPDGWYEGWNNLASSVLPMRKSLSDIKRAVRRSVMRTLKKQREGKADGA